VTGTGSDSYVGSDAASVLRQLILAVAFRDLEALSLLSRPGGKLRDPLPEQSDLARRSGEVAAKFANELLG
jgi:hypothetical protein